MRLYLSASPNPHRPLSVGSVPVNLVSPANERNLKKKKKKKKNFLCFYTTKTTRSA